MIDRYGSGIPDPVPAAEMQIDPDPNPEAEVTIDDIARALGIQVDSTRVKARREGWPRRIAPASASDERSRHGGRRRHFLYRVDALPAEVRHALAGLGDSDPVSCACCGKSIADPEQALACGRCEEAVCARRGCMRGDKCRRCRRASRNWRYRNRAALARAAAALDASRAARGECPAAELWEGAG